MQMFSDYPGVAMSNKIERPEDDERVADVRLWTRVAVARALAAATQGARPDGDVRPSLRSACDAARRHGLEAETLILMLKDSWRLLAAPLLIDRYAANSALQRLVTMCIDEFYIQKNDDRALS